MNSKFLSVSPMNASLAILKIPDARRDLILAGGLKHRFPWRHLRWSKGAWIRLQHTRIAVAFAHWSFLLLLLFFLGLKQ